MWNLLFLFSVIPIVLALVARWWFGLRVLAELGGRPCRCDLTRWQPPEESGNFTFKAEESAYEFGRQLRLIALAEWEKETPKAAASRMSSKRFGMAVPPLSGIVAIMALIVAKIPAKGAIAAFFAATALSALFGILSLAPELAAINRCVRNLRKNRSFARTDDEDAVVRCAMAHAWKETLPPLLAMFQK